MKGSKERCPGGDRMKRYKVNSSEFRTVGYDLPSLTLETEYHSGEVYQYFDVPERLVLNMLEAESIGRFFNAHIRPKFRFRQIQSRKRFKIIPRTFD